VNSQRLTIPFLSGPRGAADTANVRRILLAALLLSLGTACARHVEPSVAPPPAPVSTADQVVGVARSLVGIRYLNGGTTPDGFDCSGFVQFVFGEVGITLPREVREQAEIGERVDRADLRPGDVVFFAIDGHTISHVGIAVSADAFVHAPSSRGFVREESLNIDYWRKRFVEARRFNKG